MKTKRLFQWVMAAALVMCLPLCMTSCNDDDIDNPVTPPDQSTEEPTDDAVDVTTDKSYVLYGAPSEGIGEAVCRRLKGSETVPFLAEVYVIDPSKSDELGIGIENWKEMVRRTWYGDAAIVLTQCSYRNFYRFTVNYVLAALALKAEMNGEELDLGNYDSKHVSAEREVLANAVRNAYQMYRANHSAPGEVTEKDWAHIDQWPDEEQNAIMLDAYGFCQGNELYVMNAAVNKPDTIDGQIIPVAQPKTAYQWGQKANAVADWINRQGKEDAQTRAGMENFRRAITRADDSSISIEKLMKAQQHEAVLDYKYSGPWGGDISIAYGAIRVNYLVYSAYQFDDTNSGKDIEYYQVIQHITAMNDKIYHECPNSWGWQQRYNDGYYNLGFGAWMAQIYTKMSLEGKGEKSIMYTSPMNNNGQTSGSRTSGGSKGFSVGGSLGGNVPKDKDGNRFLSYGGNLNFSYSQNWTWSDSEQWIVQDLATECNRDNDQNMTVLWIHNGSEPRNFDETADGKMREKKLLTNTCTTSENVIWEVHHPEGTYKLKAYFHVMAATLRMHDEDLAKKGHYSKSIKSDWKTHSIIYTQSPFDISFVLNTPYRYKYIFSNAIYDYGSAQGDQYFSALLRNYINNKFGSGAEIVEDRCWSENFTSSEATKNGSENARSLFQTFKNRVYADKQAIKAANFGGQIKFVLKPIDKAEIIESFILDLDKNEEGDIITETVSGYDLTFKVTKVNEEVKLESVPRDFQGVLNIPAKIVDGLKVTALGVWCCENRNGVTEVHVPEGVKEIKEGAFYNSVNISKIFLPSTLTKIGKNAIYANQARKLSEVHICATTPPVVGDDVFFVNRGITLYVPHGCKEAYANAGQWNKFENIVEE
ncbi:MAG: leucine-rich repeat protein [Bacteroidaceae bacterium]|nr:leucine-rich repeat protein [Bacteroidaceae bacterium]